MKEYSRKKKVLRALEVALLVLVLAALAPAVVASVLILYVFLRYRGAVPRSTITLDYEKERRAGIKTMSELMQMLEAIPFHPRLSRQLATALLTFIDTVPMLLNTNRATAGLVYPYPEVFEPVMLESQDGTTVCGLLGMQPGADQKPALIIVHGLFGSKNNYPIQELALEAYYRWGLHVCVLDLRNFGDSSRFSEAPTCWGYRESDDILAAAEYLGSIEQVSTVGVCASSMGAASALLAAARSRVDWPLTGGVVALNGFADARRVVEHVSTMGHTVEGFLIWLTFRALLLLKTTLSGPGPFQDLRKYTREVSSQYYELTEQELYRKASPIHSAAGIEVPCLVIHARDDLIVPVAEAEELAAAVKDNPMVGVLILPAGGHAQYQLTCRRWFYSTLKTFFLYWGEWSVCLEPGEAGISIDNMFENPNN